MINAIPDELLCSQGNLNDRLCGLWDAPGMSIHVIRWGSPSTLSLPV